MKKNTDKPRANTNLLIATVLLAIIAGALLFMLVAKTEKARTEQSTITKLNKTIGQLTSFNSHQSSELSQDTSSSSNYNDLETAVLNDPANDSSLNQLYAQLKEGKLLIPIGNKCTIGNLTAPYPAIAVGAPPTLQEQSRTDCWKIIDDTFISEYIANNTPN